MKFVKILSYPTLPDFRNIAGFFKVPKLRPFDLLVIATCRRK